MGAKVAVSKRLRYEVLRRDGYKCRYCGKGAPDVEITVDHVIPRALGGSDEPTNLCAACRTCNDGKTSSSPDAPLVADVADDALQWARAMQVATTRMLADLDAREADREQFRQWWGNWTYNDNGERRPLDMPSDWKATVDQLVVAGLPLRVLKDCIGRSMERKRVSNDQKFRYMCGVAWKKLTELQNAARELSGSESAGAAVPAGSEYDRGRLELAQQLLSELPEEERAHFRSRVDLSEYADELDAPQTETDLASDAIYSAVGSLRTDLEYLLKRIEETLRGLPDDIGETALAVPESDEWSMGPLSTKTFWLADALYVVEDLLAVPAARVYLDGLPAEERTEWMAFARALYPRIDAGSERLIARAAECARVVTAGSLYEVMCTARGEHIPACPQQATHRVWIAEIDCCGLDGSDGHKGHLMCEAHAGRLVDGTYVNRRGEALSARDFAEITDDEKVPF